MVAEFGGTRCFPEQASEDCQKHELSNAVTSLILSPQAQHNRPLTSTEVHRKGIGPIGSKSFGPSPLPFI